MFVVYGAVTHTNAAWTTRANPVSGGGLSFFTKTSDGTETTFVDTINGANWPVVWAAYEFPSGTTWTSSANNPSAAAAWSLLSGLPGTAQVVFGAMGIVSSSGNGGNISTATWSGLWVEDTEISTIVSGTEGGSLMIGHQINVTATSITPTATVAFSGAAPGAVDSQTVTGALDVAVLLAAPTVDALGDRYLALGATMERTAIVAANGATVTAQGWSLTSGTGSPATLSSTADLSWTPTSLGTYGLRFSATNSQGTTTQDITVTVVNGVWHKDAMSDMYRMGRF